VNKRRRFKAKRRRAEDETVRRLKAFLARRERHTLSDGMLRISQGYLYIEGQVKPIEVLNAEIQYTRCDGCGNVLPRSVSAALCDQCLRENLDGMRREHGYQ
jgi:hypothetical protein